MQNDSVFAVDELTDWKAAQIIQGSGTVVTDTDLANLVQTLESTLSALYDALRVAIAVDVVGGRPQNGGIITMPVEGLSEIQMPLSSSTMLVGVKVVNKSSAGVEIAGAGFHLDFGPPTASYSTWIFGGEWTFPHRLEGRSTAHWYVDDATVLATFAKLAKQHGVVVRRFRPFAASVTTRPRRGIGATPASFRLDRRADQAVRCAGLGTSRSASRVRHG